MDLSRARAGRYARAGARWARLLAAGKPRPGVRVFYGHDRVPGAGRASRRRDGEVAEARRALPEHARRDFSLLYLGSTWLPRDLGPLLGLARRRGIPVVVNQDGVGYPGWAGDRDRGGQPAAAARAPRRRPRPLPERVLEALGRPVPRASRADRGRSCRTRSTSTCFTPAERTAGRPARCCSSAATRRRRTGSSSRCGRSPRSCRVTRTRGCSSPGGSCRRSSRSSTSSGCASACRARRRVRAARRAGALPARARAPAHEGQRPLPDARPRGDGVRAARRLPGERRHGRARRRRGRRRRAAPGDVGARRATCARGARRRRRARARRPAALRGGGAAQGGGALRARAVARPSRRAVRGARPGSRRAGRGASRSVERAARSRSTRATSETSAPPTGRTSIRATRRERVAVLAEHVADAGAVAVADRASSAQRVVVVDRERGVVRDPGAARTARMR